MCCAGLTYCISQQVKDKPMLPHRNFVKFEENTFYEHMRKDIMMRPKDASFKLEGCDQHNKGMEIDDLAVTVGDNLFAP